MRVRRASLSFAAGHRVNYYSAHVSSTKILEFRARKFRFLAPLAARATLTSLENVFSVGRRILREISTDAYGSEEFEGVALSCRLNIPRAFIRTLGSTRRASRPRAHVCVRAKTAAGEFSQVACGIRQEHSNIQSDVIYERLIHGVPQILSYKTTRVRCRLSHARRIGTIAFSRCGRAGADLEIILHSGGSLFREISGRVV